MKDELFMILFAILFLGMSGILASFGKWGLCVTPALVGLAFIIISAANIIATAITNSNKR